MRATDLRFEAQRDHARVNIYGGVLDPYPRGHSD